MQLRIFLPAMLALLLLLLAGCSQKSEVTCNTPYLKVGTECCLDQNGNSVCDKDESSLGVPSPNQTAQATAAVVCNKPYILVGVNCCLDKNDNKICDSEDAPEKLAQAVDNQAVDKMKLATNALNAVVSISAHSPLPHKNDRGGVYYEDEDVNGSGFFVSNQGIVLTNSHVVENYVLYCYLQSQYVKTSFSCSIKAKTYEGYVYDLEWLGYSYEWDLAVLKIKDPSRQFPHLEFAKTSGNIGDTLYVLGAPEGLDFSLAKGVISQKNRDSYRMEGDKKYSKYLQTDAAINLGNSGGPIIDENGRVVAMATYGYLFSEGLNFGLQSEDLQDAYDRILNDTPKILKNTNDLTSPYAESYTKNVTLAPATDMYFYTFKDDIIFNLLEFHVTNKMNATVNLCFNVKVATWSGFVKYEKESDLKIEAKPKSVNKVQIKPDLTLEGSVIHIYIIEVFNCDTKTKYGRVYGAGDFREDVGWKYE